MIREIAKGRFNALMTTFERADWSYFGCFEEDLLAVAVEESVAEMQMIVHRSQRCFGSWSCQGASFARQMEVVLDWQQNEV